MKYLEIFSTVLITICLSASILIIADRLMPTPPSHDKTLELYDEPSPYWLEYHIPANTYDIIHIHGGRCRIVAHDGAEITVNDGQ